MPIRALSHLSGPTLVLAMAASIAAAETQIATLGTPPVAPAAADGGLAVQRGIKSSSLEVTTDSAVALQSDVPFTELSIANPSIADISTMTNRLIHVLGKKAGRTTLMLMGAEGEILTVVDIRVVPDITELTRRLEAILPGEPIEAFTANDGIVLSGAVSSAARVQQALELARHYAPGRISNLMTVAEAEAEEPPAEDTAPVAIVEAAPPPAPVPDLPDPAEIAAQLKAILPGEAIEVHGLGDAIVLTGTVSSETRKAQALQVARLLIGDAEMSDLMTVEATQDCVIRTRRGGEVIETRIPCRN